MEESFSHESKLVVYCGHLCKSHQVIMLYQLQRIIHHLFVHGALMVICDDNAFQAASNLLQKCPTTNVCITFTNDNKGRSMKTNFICPFGYRNGSLNDICSEYRIFKPNGVYIITSAACGSQCITYFNSATNDISVCTVNGICDYDFYRNSENNNIKYSPTQGPTNSPTEQPTQFLTNNPTLPPYITWSDNVKLNDKLEYLYTSEPISAYNITYDLYYFIQEYLRDNMEHNITFNLFCLTITHKHANTIGICNINENHYDFGYINQPHNNDANAEMRITGTDMQLYDQNNRIEGLKSSYEKEHLFADAIEFEIYNTWNDIF